MDMPNTVTEAQKALHAAIKRRHWNWWLIGMPLVLVGMIAVARWV